MKISAETERQAYDALEHGAAIESLLTETNDKPRNDEAKLAKDRGSFASFQLFPRNVVVRAEATWCGLRHAGLGAREG